MRCWNLFNPMTQTLTKRKRSRQTLINLSTRPQSIVTVMVAICKKKSAILKNIVMVSSQFLSRAENDVGISRLYSLEITVLISKLKEWMWKRKEISRITVEIWSECIYELGYVGVLCRRHRESALLENERFNSILDMLRWKCWELPLLEWIEKIKKLK